ncbi:hypothetical protein ACROYT_G029530 [Oculina patagonica]
MVFFHNINPGARVQVRWRGEVENGTIRYAGNLVAKDGEWVGIELDNRVGNTSGLYKGIQYFHCRDGHGIFTHARNVRFVPSKRTLRDSYKPVSKTSVIDETLFAKTEATPVKSSSDPEVISPKYLNRVKTMIQGEDAWPEARTRFNKSHLVGAHISPATRQRSQSATSLHREEYFNWNKPFISPSSIPHIHVPRPILKRMLGFEYFGTTIPRYSSLS